MTFIRYRNVKIGQLKIKMTQQNKKNCVGNFFLCYPKKRLR